MIFREPEWVCALRVLNGDAQNHHCIAYRHHLIVVAFSGFSKALRAHEGQVLSRLADMQKERGDG